MVDLPGALREIAEVVGVETALRLAQLRGGARMSIPAHVRPDSWLALAIGEEKAKALSAHFTSGYTTQELEIPLGPVGARAQLVASVRQLIREGIAHEEIARRLGVSSRMVRRHRAALKAAEQGIGPTPVSNRRQVSSDATDAFKGRAGQIDGASPGSRPASFPD